MSEQSTTNVQDLPSPRPASGYVDLFAVPSFAALAGTMLLARLGGNMWGLVIVLFVLDRFHSPSLAGLVVFFSLAPGLVISPLAGALLDRSKRARLLALDLGIGFATVLVIALLAMSGHLSPTLLVLVVGVSSLTVPLTGSGMKTLVPTLVPRSLWDRANAVDSGIGYLTLFTGPAIAGLFVAAIGGLPTLLVIGAMWLAGAVLALVIREAPASAQATAHIVRDAWNGVRYLVSNPVLRGLTIIMPLANVGFGAFVVALPVLILRHGGNARGVGILWSVFAGAALLTGAVFGRTETEGRERSILAGTLLISAVGFMLVALSRQLFLPLIVAGVGLAVAGLADAPMSVTMSSLRQRTTEPDQLGRALSISSSVNWLGEPIGSGLAGAAIALSLEGTMIAAAALIAVCSLLSLRLLPQARPTAYPSTSQ